MKRNSQHGKMIRILLLCLCAALLAGTAIAENTEIADINDYPYTNIAYCDTLADGRILLAGSADRTGSEIVPRLLCLNTDRTVSWDYLNEAAKPGLYISAAELADGTVGAVLRVSKGSREEFYLQFFTPDGETARKDIRIPVDEDTFLCSSTQSRLVLGGAGKKANNYIFDWEGNEIARISEPEMGLLARGVIDEEDGLVLFGAVGIWNPGHESRAEILKTDLRGNILWKQLPPPVWPDTAGCSFMYALPEEDGGYLTIQSEYLRTDEQNREEYRNALVKLGSGGEILRTGTEGLENEKEGCRGLVRYGGKIAAYFDAADPGTDSRIRGGALLFRWFDENGTFLGTTELKLSGEDFERLGGDARIDVQYNYQAIPMQDGLWMPALLQITAQDSAILDTVLVKVPEL